jgi:hypothetical protein
MLVIIAIVVKVGVIVELSVLDIERMCMHILYVFEC